MSLAIKENKTVFLFKNNSAATGSDIHATCTAFVAPLALYSSIVYFSPKGRHHESDVGAVDSP